MFSIPKMILFDYGSSLLCEPDWDALRGERAVLAHAVSNPRHVTPEALAAWEHEYLRSRRPLRDLDAELPMLQLLRLKYALHGIRLDISLEEAEFLQWSSSSPMTEGCVSPHIREVLEALEERGIRTGVISNLGWSGAALKKRIDTLLPNNRFDFILTSSDYGVRKPDVRLFQTALAIAGLEPEEAWYCGNDFRKDYLAPRSAGMFSVLYRGFSDKPSAPAEIPGGTVTIDDWQELLGLLDQCG